MDKKKEKIKEVRGPAHNLDAVVNLIDNYQDAVNNLLVANQHMAQAGLSLEKTKMKEIGVQSLFWPIENNETREGKCEK